MKKIIFWLNFLIIIIAVNAMVAIKENTVNKGRTVLIRLVPVDPRSLMQGDYMRLNYEISGRMDDGSHTDGRIVVALDKNNVASFVDFYDGICPLKENEVLLKYKKRGERRISIGAESFMFQEGNDKLYSRAKFGELKVDSSGSSVLVGLRDDKFNPLMKHTDFK